MPSILITNQILYPNENWILGNFRFSRNKTWTNAGNVREYLASLETSLGVLAPDDWYSISKQQVSFLRYSVT